MISLLVWLASLLPLGVLFALVFSGRCKTSSAALIALGSALAIAASVFGAGSATLLPALAKGAWLGLWILCVVWPALLLYRLASAAGLARIGAVFASILPRRRDNLLIVAWVLPAFIQGVAGFGTPIAVAAPLVLAMGWPADRAVLYPLIGYFWAVTFGSMGSSFYMAALTAHLSPSDQVTFALTAAGFLGVLCLLAGATVLWLDGGLGALRAGAGMLLAVGVPMALTLVATARAVPAVASLAAGAAGFVAVGVRAAWLRRQRRTAPPRRPLRRSPAGAAATTVPLSTRRALQLVSPYLYLLLTALPVFLWPPTREWVHSAVVLAPAFPASTTAAGWTVSAVPQYQPLPVFGHPGTFVLLACVLGFLTYRATGLWGQARLAPTLRGWLRSLPAASWPVLLLAMVATVLTDAGMVAVLARGIAGTTGAAFPALSPVVGALGSFMTGSTTVSNALFASLQTGIARLLQLDPTVLLAGQTAGGNVGNALAPVVILIGATAVGRPQEVPRILRTCAPPAGALLLVVAVLTAAVARL